MIQSQFKIPSDVIVKMRLPSKVRTSDGISGPVVLTCGHGAPSAKKAVQATIAIASAEALKILIVRRHLYFVRHILADGYTRSQTLMTAYFL
jgi:hypothetical protein